MSDDEDSRLGGDEGGKGRGPADDPDADDPGADHLIDLRLRDLERGPGWFATYGQPLWRVLLLLVMLIGIIVFRQPCADGVAGFVGNFSPPSRVARDGGVRHGEPARGPSSGAQARDGGAAASARGDAAARP